MADQLSPEHRSRVMARIKGKNTGPEIRVRKAAHSMGLRFRLNRNDLPGKPDLVFPKYLVALFVNGCFWHQHQGCRRASTPKTRMEYWGKKLRRNVERDTITAAKLAEIGWRTAVIWECEANDQAALKEIVRRRVIDASE